MTLKPIADPIAYPESDGNPIADNTKQFRWIMTIQGNLAAIFKDDPNVFVAGDLLWYPVQGRPDIRYAPDAMVIFGRPKDERGSYQQWNENNIAPQVVFEVLSPSNKPTEMTNKRNAYEQYGVEEYYIYDPDRVKLEGWQRQGLRLLKIAQMQGWISPLLQVRFGLNRQDTNNELKMYKPNGELFLSYLELDQLRQEETLSRQRAEQQLRQELKARQQDQAQIAKLREALKAQGLNPDDYL